MDGALQEAIKKGKGLKSTRCPVLASFTAASTRLAPVTDLVELTFQLSSCCLVPFFECYRDANK